jgi:hypothetical protein
MAYPIRSAEIQAVQDQRIKDTLLELWHTNPGACRPL